MNYVSSKQGVQLGKQGRKNVNIDDSLLEEVKSAKAKNVHSGSSVYILALLRAAVLGPVLSWAQKQQDWAVQCAAALSYLIKLSCWGLSE